MTSLLPRALAAFTLLATVACGSRPEDACATYLRAADDCAAAALDLAESQRRTDDDIAASCASWEDLDGEARRAATDRFDCATEAFEGCDAAGYEAAVAEADACLYE